MNDDETGEKHSSFKLSFLLSPEQIGPFPISVESLWCDKEGEFYRVKNIPFFIDEISFDDLISVTEISNGHYKIDEIIEKSKNSTIWLSIKDGANGKLLLDYLLELGCGVEGGVFDGYFAVNVPSLIDFNKVYCAIEEGERLNYALPDYPSVRHE